MNTKTRAKLGRSGLIAAAGLGIAAITAGVLGGGPTNPLVSSASAEAPAERPANGEMGFVLSEFSPAIVPGMKDNCPSGWSHTNSEAYLASISAEERDRLKKPENEKEFATRWKASTFGPNNTNVCTNYDQFPNRAKYFTVQGKTAYGIDLDGDRGDGTSKARADTCGHESFTSPEGETGIDNQYYRAAGCTRGWRGPDGSPGDIKLQFRDYITNGDYKFVMLVRGIDSLKSDNDVEVIIATTEDAAFVDSQQKFVPGATFRITDNPRWRNVLHGRIDNGVLTTDPGTIDLHRTISTGGPRNRRTEWNFLQSRLRVKIASDGGFKGLLGGYQPLGNLLQLESDSGIGTALVVSHDCAANYNTLKSLADGGRDPKTGQCTTVSSQFDVAGVRATVIDTGRRESRQASGR
jgi:hypothetical protein